MALQAKLKKMDEAADAMIRGQQTAVTEQPVVEPVATPDVPVVVQQPEPVETPVEPVEVTPAATPQADGKVQQMEAALAQAEQRFRTLQGMMDKERETNENLRTLVNQLTQQVNALTESTKAPVKEEPKLVTKADEEAFGADLVDLVRRATLEIVQGRMDGLTTTVDSKLGEVNGKVSEIGKVVAKSAAEKFDEALTAAVSDWRQINLDPTFSEWLTPYGLRALNDAYQNQDVEATAKFFNDYKVLTGKQQQQAPAPAASLDSLVTPGKPKASATQPPAQRTFSPADFVKASNDLRQRKISQADFDAFEREYFKAQSEGRIAR